MQKRFTEMVTIFTEKRNLISCSPPSLFILTHDSPLIFDLQYLANIFKQIPNVKLYRESKIFPKVYLYCTMKKYLLLFPIFSVLAYLSHLIVSNHPTHSNIRYRQCKQKQSTVLKLSFYLLKVKIYSKPISPMRKSNCPQNLITGWCG